MTRVMWALVVEADPIRLLIISNTLKEVGVRFKRNTSGANVLAQARAMQPTPDLILLDLELPEGDPAAICRELRADPRLGPIPIIGIVDLKNACPSMVQNGAGFSAFIDRRQLRKDLVALVRRAASGDHDLSLPTRSSP